MATLVSPGVSVTVVDESFYIPVSAPTVPLFFIATQANKVQPDGVTPAAGTLEHSVVRTITGITQSTQMYGVPAFRTAPEDANLPVSQRRQLHGDSRNEYGLFSLNQFLNVANLAYVIRADVDLADIPLTQINASAPTFTGVGNGTMTSVTVNQANAVAETWTIACSDSTNQTFTVTGSVSGTDTSVAVVGQMYSNGKVTFQINPGTTSFAIGDTFTVVLTSVVVGSPLGATDAAKRVSITTALKAEINSNTEIRSEIYEYNLILCPGYYECAEEMQALSQAINDEAFVIADTPFNLSAEDTATWAKSSDRVFGTDIAYYYPHGMASNLDGVSVFVASSGIAIQTIAYSDSVSEIWFAPAGVRRGMVVGVDSVGYVTGTLGTPTTYIQVNLNQGQRDALYEFGSNVNPIVFFPGRGLIVWGQKTSASAASALDRINVARLLMYIKRSLRKGAFPFVFEPNDAITQANLKASVDGFLADIMVKRGLYDFVTLCDKSNNTPTRVDNNELWCDVALKPVKAAEFIYIPVRVLSTGA